MREDKGIIDKIRPRICAAMPTAKVCIRDVAKRTTGDSVKIYP